ncbi:MAG: hypothetical protein H6700_09780 [Myxococcales bacterium]|nr:hypothetical protein [Myxococcales bacterium]MCB9532043.1 hypothetical protein [Myxococcales bacterium]
MNKRWLSLAATSAAMFASSLAAAQTADGVGDGSIELTDDESGLSVDDITRLAEYERRFYQVSLRMRAIDLPGFFLDPFFSQHTNQWTQGVKNFSYGGEFTTSLPRRYDLVVGAEWVNMRTPDGYWLEDGDPVADANWTESNLSLATVDVMLRWFRNLNRQETFQLTYGVNLGASVVLGEFRKQDLDTAACGDFLDTAEERNSTNPAVLSNCFDADGNPTVINDTVNESIPPVLPVLGVGVGFRYLIADHVSVALEGGFKGYLYGGLNIGYFWEVGPKL